MDKITLSKMEFYGYHGVFAEERKLGQRFYIDVELLLPLTQAGQSDQLDHTINYADVYEMAKDIVEKETFQLIESIAERIASLLLQTYTSINEIIVRVHKPHPPFPVKFEGVVVEIHRKRAQIDGISKTI